MAQKLKFDYPDGQIPIAFTRAQIQALYAFLTEHDAAERIKSVYRKVEDNTPLELRGAR
jgi:hypothetical protein